MAELCHEHVASIADSITILILNNLVNLIEASNKYLTILTLEVVVEYSPSNNYNINLN